MTQQTFRLLVSDAHPSLFSRRRPLAGGTHLVHLETGRRALYEAVGRSLKGA
jgi:hypothetical protein